MRTIWAAAGVGALLAGGMLVASPASAVPYPITIDKQNTGPASIVAGGSQRGEFTVTVTYTEPPPLPGVQNTPMIVRVVDFMPDGLQLAEVPAGCTGDVGGTYLECAADFSSEEVQAFVVKVQAAAGLRPGTYFNCAVVEPLDAPPLDVAAGSGNCPFAAPEVGEYVIPTAQASVEVTNDADLELTASQPGTVDPGAAAQITWTVKNNGPSGADAPLTLTATLPAGVTWVSGGAAPWECTMSGQDVTCTYTPALTGPEMGCAPQVGSDTCNFVQAILPGAEIPPLTWDVTTKKPGTVAKYDVVASVTSPTPDSKPANNSATSTINVTPVDLAIAKSAGSPVIVGDEATWTVNVRNVGAIDDAAKVTVTDTLPVASTFVAASGDGWTCEAAGQKLTCSRDGLAKGASSDIVVRSTMTARGDATNKAEVSSQSYEKNVADNTAEKTVKVVRTEQTAAELPATPSRVKSGKTEQGQKLTTTVRCRPVKASAAGEVSFCKVTRGNGVVKIKVKGSQPMKVTVVQTAKGTAKFKPFVQRKTYVVRP